MFSSPQVAGLAHLLISAGNDIWLSTSSRDGRMLCKIACHPLKLLSCKAPLGNAISQMLGSVVLAELVIKQISVHPSCGLVCDCL